MTKPFDPFFYFFWKGLCYGTLMGVLSGTMMFPLVGTVVGLSLGGVWGALGGLIIGLLVMFYNACFLRYNTDQQSYRRKLTCIIGMITTIGMFCGLYGMFFALYPAVGPLSSSAVTPEQNYEIWVGIVNNLMFTFGIPAVIVAGMTAAYTTNEYADWYFSHITKSKNGTLVASKNHSSEIQSLTRWYIRECYQQLPRGLFLTVIMGLLMLCANPRFYAGFYGSTEIVGRIGELIFIGSFAAIYSVCITPFLAYWNVLLIKWLNRVIFREYFPNIRLKQYRWSVAIISGIVIFICSPVATLIIGMPAATLIAARVAWVYATRLYKRNNARKEKRVIVSG